MEEHLERIYGHDSFRPNQREIISEILSGGDVCAVMPTGAGKSILYQFPATYSNKTSIVVSPLISLMNDQCISMSDAGIRCIGLNSETDSDYGRITDHDLVYTTPEFISSNLQLFVSYASDIGLLAIDEAHCVSQWSHDFRSSYKQLGRVRRALKGVPLLAVTATATPRVLEEMYEILSVEEITEFLLGTRRTNLAISVLPKSKFSECSYEVPTIVYVSTRKLCEEVSSSLIASGVKACRYHGGMSKPEKERSHHKFVAGEITVVVATISFGMGIDKADIRHVVNYGVPTDIESYYQEIGRAGRDGLPSKATVYYGEQDFATIGMLISHSQVSAIQKRHKIDAMNTMRTFLNDKIRCRQCMIDQYFAHGSLSVEVEGDKCGICDNCMRASESVRVEVGREARATINAIRSHFRRKEYYLGVDKTVALVMKSDPALGEKTKAWTKSLIEELVAREYLRRTPVGKFGTIVLALGSNTLRDCEQFFANVASCPPSSKRSEGKGSAKRTSIRLPVLQGYRDGEPPNVIANRIGVPLRKVEDQLVALVEKDPDTDIDLEYFNVDDEMESEVRDAYAILGKDQKTLLRSIRSRVPRCSFLQIRVCLAVLALEDGN